MNPERGQAWNVVSLSEKRYAKNSKFGPIQKGIVKRGKPENYRQHSDEAMALGNSWREEK